MSHGEGELWSLLRQAVGMDRSEAQQALLEDVIRHADAGNLFQVAFHARRYLADAYSVAAQWHKAFPLFARCLSDHDRWPEQFGPEEDLELHHWYPNIIQSMAEFPDITLDQIRQAFDDVESRFRVGGHNPRPVYDARRWVAQTVCDWEEEERCHRLWWEAGGPQAGSVWDFEVDVERLVLRGDEDSLARAREIAAPALAREIAFDEPPWPIQCLMLLPMAKAGEFDAVMLARRQSLRELVKRPHRIEYGAMHIEFCALTNNFDQGSHYVWKFAHKLENFSRPTGEMEMAAAIALLTRRMEEAGRGEELMYPYWDDERRIPATTLRRDMTARALDLAARFDARNGTTAQGDRIRAKIAAEPVVDFLPLTPTSRKLVPKPVARGLSPEQTVDRGEWHLRAMEYSNARACLDRLPTSTPPPHLAGRVAELRALLEWGPNDESALRWAAEEHQRNGDHRRHLLCRCWLARWLAENQQGEQALAEATKALDELHQTGDPWVIAWGELRMAQVLVALREDGVYPAVQRAARYAVESGDPLAVGVIATLEAFWREGDEADPPHVIRLATRAKDALLKAGAYMSTIDAFDLLCSAYARADHKSGFVSLVRWHLDHLPPHAPEEVRAHLLYHHGREMVREDRHAEAVPVLTEATSTLRTRGLDPTDLWYVLAAASHNAGQFDTARHAAEEIADTLDALRAKGELQDPVQADACRLTLADSYRHLGEHDAALDHYAHLAAQAREFDSHATPLVAGALTDMARLLASLGRVGEAVERSREAAEAHAESGNPHAAVACRCLEVRLLFTGGDTDAALDGLRAAERAIEAVPTEPASGRASAQGLLDDTGARIMAELGRTSEAVTLAERASVAYLHADQPSAAVEMDLLQARILLDGERPDLVQPPLDRALEECEEDDPRRETIAHLLAEALSQLGHEEEAEAFMRRVQGHV